MGLKAWLVVSQSQFLDSNIRFLISYPPKNPKALLPLWHSLLQASQLTPVPSLYLYRM